jgi:DNA-directed RNA polymerase subunit RPC12/RpoP
MPSEPGSATLTAMDVRFRDPAADLHTFLAEDIAVVCPRCHSRALVTTRPVERRAVMSWPRRFVCPACVHTEAWSPTGRRAHWAVAADPFFRLPLWLQADVRGHRLWAFNTTHLTFLEHYVAATLRERPLGFSGMTLIAKLPAWLKSAKLRPDLLRIITRLRAAH